MSSSNKILSDDIFDYSDDYLNFKTKSNEKNNYPDWEPSDFKD